MQRLTFSRRANEARLPARVDRIVTRCLQKRPRDRYPSSEQLASALTGVLRRQSMAPLDQLVRRAVARAGLGDTRLGDTRLTDLGSPSEHKLTGPEGRWRLMVALAAGGLILVTGVVTRCSSGEVMVPFRGDARGIVKRPAKLKLLAQPWAEIHIDGRLIDVTPIGHWVPVTPGKHVVEFKHPQAATQTRHIEVISEQQLIIDVHMPVLRPESSPSATAAKKPKSVMNDEDP
jgi:hypothetical protein